MRCPKSVGRISVAASLLTGSLAACGHQDAGTPEPFAARAYLAGDPYAGESHACADDDEQEVLEAVNRARRLAGAPPVSCLPALHGVAAEHAAFLAANEGAPLATRHDELPGAPHFRGRTPGERADAAGIDRSAFFTSEGVGGSGTLADMVEVHLRTVYHRSHLLTPGARYLAFARLDGPTASHVVFDTLAWINTAGLGAAVYPGPGQGRVARGFTPARELPDPAADVMAAGLPVSVHFPRPVARDGGEPGLPTVRAFALTVAATGAVVPARRLDASTDVRVYRSDVFLLPLQPFAPATTYRVTVDAAYGGVEAKRTWTFVTE